MGEHDSVGEVVGRRVVPQGAPRRVRVTCPEQDVEDDVAGEGVGVESPEGHLLEQLEYERVEAPTPVQPEKEQESLGPYGAAEAMELAEEGGGGAEARGEASGGGDEAVEGARRVEVTGAAGAPEEE
jgi:hypothetical protein